MFTKCVLFVTALLCAALLNSCTDTPATLKASSGKTAEILFIIDKSIWNNPAGDSIKSLFRSEFPGLGQPEPMFTTAQIEERAMSGMFEAHRNIIICRVHPDSINPVFELRKNVWAQPQLVFKIVTTDAQSLVTMLTKNRQQIIDYLYENERERMVRAFTRDADPAIATALTQQYGFTLTIPKGYFIAKKLDNFCWIRRETEETSIGILYYSYPYTDTISFNQDYILNLRDSLTALHIPGPSDGSYQQVSRKVVMPLSTKTTFLDRYAVETRGLWDVKGDYMGGPFISYTFVDEQNNKVITLDGFVYAPRFDKRDYVIQVEALLGTWQKK